MDKRLLRRVFVIVITFMTPGCATVYLDMTQVGKPVSMSETPGKPYKVLRHFNYERKAYFILLGFIKISNPDFTDVLKTEINDAQGDAVVNTSIEVEYDLLDTIFPYGIGAIGWAVFGPMGFNLSYGFTMQTYRIKGDVIRYSP